MTRSAVIDRETQETKVHLRLDLDGAGNANVASGVGFLDHMLVLLARHALFDLDVQASGDFATDDHHTVEDIGICLGQALAQALGDKQGIWRYGHMTLPMDESLASVTVDLAGRTAFVWNVPVATQKIGTFDTQLAEEFWSAAAHNARMNYHAQLHYGRNAHHVIEAVFKASARALRQAATIDPRQAGTVPSSKGIL